MNSIEALPGKRFTPDQIDELNSKLPDHLTIRVESELLLDSGDVVVALTVVNRESDGFLLLGLVPGEWAWETVDRWRYDDLEHDAFYARLDQWVAETFQELSVRRAETSWPEWSA